MLLLEQEFTVLSTAWKLAEKLKTGKDIVVIDKSGIASGASGIACGVVRNNYFQPAMRELMAHSVKVWESDPKAFHYHPIGYMQISPESMRERRNNNLRTTKKIRLRIRIY